MAVTGFAHAIKPADGLFLEGPVAASTTCYRHAIVMRDSAGRIKNGATAVNCRGVGVADYNDVVGNDANVWDNSSGSAAAFNVKYKQGVWGPFANSGTSIVAGDEGRDCFIVDNVTVHADSGAGTRSPAGKIAYVNSRGVWVEFCEDDANAAQGDVRVIPIPVVLSKHTTNSIAARFTPGFHGEIVKMTFSVTDPATTAAKLATFTPAIATVSTTGGAVALTSANCTPVGAKVDGSAITAASEFTATDEITIAASAVTAFVEGQGVLYLTLRPL